MTIINRSEFLGVYNNKSANSMSEVPFRAAIRRGNGETANWVNLGYTKSEKVAAKVYNMYAVNFFGKGAILNDTVLSSDETEEFNTFVQAKPKRTERFNEAHEKACKLRTEGHTFRLHTSLKKKA
jgi:hypothetical protein